MKPEPLTPTDCRDVLATAQRIAPVDASAFAPLWHGMRVMRRVS